MRIRSAALNSEHLLRLTDQRDSQIDHLIGRLNQSIESEHCDWVDLEEPTHEAMQIIDGLLGQEAGFISAIYANTDADCTYLESAAIFRTERVFYHFESDSCSGRPLLLIMLAHRVISLHPITLSRTIGHVFQTVGSRGRDLLGQPCAGIMLCHFIEELVEDYKPVLEAWQDELDSYERNCLTSAAQDTLMEILRFKKLVAQLRQAIHGVYREQRRFVTRCPQVFLDEDSRNLAWEANYRFEALLNEIESIRLHTASAYQVYAAALNLEMSHSSNQMSKVMERLALVTSVFMPLTFIVGVYGMNIPGMPELNIHGFYYVLWGVMFLIAMGLLYFFKRMRWY